MFPEHIHISPADMDPIWGFNDCVNAEIHSQIWYDVSFPVQECVKLQVFVHVYNEVWMTLQEGI